MTAFSPATLSDRLVLGLVPPPAAAAAIIERVQTLGRALGVDRPRIAPERFHLGLHSLGAHAGLRPDIVAMAAEAAAALIWPDEIELQLDVIESRPSAGPGQDLVLASRQALPALAEFRQALGLGLARAGLGRHVDRPFRPHVLLARQAPGHHDHSIAPIAWTAREFSLLHVPLAQTAPVPLGRWPLGRAAEVAADT